MSSRLLPFLVIAGQPANNVINKALAVDPTLCRPAPIDAQNTLEALQEMGATKMRELLGEAVKRQKVGLRGAVMLRNLSNVDSLAFASYRTQT